MQLAKHLQSLDEHDPGRVIIVRKISRLGFGSHDILREFFEHFGPVDEVLLVNHADKTDEANHHRRVRPSGMGYILMRKAEDVEAVFACGEEMMVQHTLIGVRRFLRRELPASSDAAGDDAAGGGNAELVPDFDREGCSFVAQQAYFFDPASAIPISI